MNRQNDSHNGAHPLYRGHANIPGIDNQAQNDAWRKVTEAVHAKGSCIFLRLRALGRSAKPATVSEEAGGDWFTSSSAVPILAGGHEPRELREEEFWEYIGGCAQGARNAVAAGFDGVEILWIEKDAKLTMYNRYTFYKTKRLH